MAFVSPWPATAFAPWGDAPPESTLRTTASKRGFELHAASEAKRVRRADHATPTFPAVLHPLPPPPHQASMEETVDHMALERAPRELSCAPVEMTMQPRCPPCFLHRFCRPGAGCLVSPPTPSVLCPRAYAARSEDMMMD